MGLTAGKFENLKLKGGGSQEAKDSPSSEEAGGRQQTEPGATFPVPFFKLLLQPLALTLNLWLERQGLHNVASGHPASCKCTIDFSR